MSLTARSAHKRTRQTIKELTRDQIDEVDTKIEEAIENAQFDITLDESEYTDIDKIISTYENNGFQVGKSDDGMVVISWETQQESEDEESEDEESPPPRKRTRKTKWFDKEKGIICK
jgi:hypothetical protein